MTDSSAAIVDLQSRWHTLKDPDRGLAIASILRSGVSGRSLAAKLNCSEATVRRLYRCSKASAEDLELARQGMISTSELIRRIEKAEINQQRLDKQDAERSSLQRIATAKDAILNWLAADPASKANAEQIVSEARRRMMWAEETGGMPQSKVPVTWTRDQIIASSRPAHRDADELDVSWFARWICEWLFHSVPNRNERWSAVDQELSHVSSRFWKAYLRSAA